jgi:hypothetical protein
MIRATFIRLLSKVAFNTLTGIATLNVTFSEINGDNRREA